MPVHNHLAPRGQALLARNDLERKVPLEDRAIPGRGLVVVDKIIKG